MVFCILQLQQLGDIFQSNPLKFITEAWSQVKMCTMADMSFFLHDIAMKPFVTSYISFCLGCRLWSAGKSCSGHMLMGASYLNTGVPRDICSSNCSVRPRKIWNGFIILQRRRCKPGTFPISFAKNWLD